ncbi:MAG: trypsin-like peptidase domain-containing protein [Ramlibacter sp.]|jgi:serine protease Do|nr:trypsin-like peptidase domain-containing protein [Ramlibacter sp.]
MRRSHSIVAIAIASWMIRSYAQGLAPDILFEKVSPSVWVVQTSDAQGRPVGRGSAVVTAPGRLVTNCHVLAKSNSFVVKRDNVSYGATLEFPDPERDLCQIKVANFTAPPVELADIGKLRVGAKVYAIGNPRGLEVTLSDGLISGLRKTDKDELEMVQTTAPISPGSSGGGLFDAEGRLVGITTALLRDSQNLNFAVPANWIVELAARGQANLDKRTAPVASAAPRAARAPGGGLQAGDAFEYVVVDLVTNTRQSAVHRVDGTDGSTVRFNGGTRSERVNGEVIEMTQPVAGAMDSAMPPGGWAGSNLQPGRSWQSRYRTGDAATGNEYDLNATASTETEVSVPAGKFPAILIRYDGYVTIAPGGRMPGGYRGRVDMKVWYATDLRRVIRFEYDARAQFFAPDRQVVELVRIDRAP